MGVVFLVSAGLCLTYTFGYTLLSPAVHFVVFSILTICLFTDLEHQIIPNETSFGLIIVGLLHSFFQQT